MVHTDQESIGELVEGLLGPTGPTGRRPPGEEAELWLQALDGLRERLRDRGALPRTPRPLDDPFGLDPEAIERVRPFAEFLYHRWFRVRSHGFEHVPAEGPAILVANHGGVLPFDGAMLIADGLFQGDPPRVLRSLVDRWVQDLPVIQPFYAAVGQVIGTRENFRALLAGGERVLVFPEGAAGIGKSFLSRFLLEPFHPGFVEEAVRANVPVVPVALTGPESQAPVIADLQGVARRLGMPTLPIPVTFPLIPLPVRYRIRYGPAITPETLSRKAPEKAARDVREHVQGMVDALRRR